MEARELDLFEFVAMSARLMPKSVFTEPDDDWTPVAFLDGPQGRTTMPLVQFMGDEMSKDILCESILPSVIKQFEATTVVMVISTWISTASSKLLTDTGKYVPPSMQADREERVMISEYTREGVTRQTWAPIIRSETEVPQLGEWSDMDAVGVGGRFVTPIVKALKGVRA